ncbi:unnamed protein product [Orchesella dallaii]|uniref:Endonuclease/exonuclease/phosphatase domain-containing protein n=1 Tax=Orchesella dallaii TaxID=48710 RepID=A0ABP1Q7D1_9HEXA
MAAIRCFQLNMHRAMAAASNLSDCMRDTGKGSHIAMLQEPYVVKGRVRGCVKGYTVVDMGTVKYPARAAVILSRDLNAWPLTVLSDRDVAAAQIMVNGKNIVFASVYMPHDTQVHPSATLRKLVEYCEGYNTDLVIGTDANSHHLLWGSSDCNDRGERLMEY